MEELSVLEKETADENSNPSEEINAQDQKTSSLPKKYYLRSDLEEIIRNDYPEVMDLIETLYKYIEKQNRKLRALKLKFKKRLRTVETAVQTDSLEESLQQNVQSITEEITQAAEQAVQNAGFVYEETSGLYYDYNTGYYYNAELGLYYDGNTGTYMRYDPATESYQFHSKIVPQSPEAVDEEPARRLKTKRKRYVRKKQQEPRKKCLLGEQNKNKEELEDGECSDSGSSDETSASSFENEDSLDSDISQPWPPCMRIIVEETTIPKLKRGSLYVITFEGGSLGREGDHSILIPDINTSKHHLKFTFDKDSSKFMAIDLGSRNGTLLNGKRMSSSKQESESMEVIHGSRIQIGSTVLLCHIHNGNETCGLCEPGLLQSKGDEKVNITRSSKGAQHKKELQRLKKKFGVTSQNNASMQLAAGYSDRAQARRDTVGSHNEHEKTEVASVHDSIKSNNIGFKLLSKMGWSEGQALGKDGSGISEPIQPKINTNSAGLGSTLSSNMVEKSSEAAAKENVWKKTQERFEQLSPSRNVFDESD